MCDELRDQKLGDLGVRMEDKEEGTVVKIVGREAILRERELERQVSGRGQWPVRLKVIVQVQEAKVNAKAEQKRRLEEAKVREVSG